MQNVCGFFKYLLAVIIHILMPARWLFCHTMSPDVLTGVTLASINVGMPAQMGLFYWKPNQTV